MNEFKILSIEEFDADFVQNIRIKKSLPKPAPQSFIPEMIKPETKPVEITSPVVSEDIQDIISSDTAIETESSPEEEEKPAKYFNKPAKDDSDDEDFTAPLPVEKQKKKKTGAGLLAGKIISIVLLCVTVVTFLLGCFTAVFLNNGADIGGSTFNAQLREIKIGDDSIKEGALIVSEKIEPNEYTENLNKPVAVPVDGKSNEGCDIMYIYSAKDVTIDNATIEVYDPISNQISSRVYSHSELFGIVTYYIPFAGSLLSFAISNAVLVCALFVLLAAFWCLIIILISKNRKKSI